jgi:putative polyhydroxyalkanoate system protein
MAKLVIREAHALAADDAARRLRDFEEVMAKYGVKARWSGARAKLTGTGVSGDIEIADDAVTVTLALGLLARAAGVDPARLERSIRRRLREALGA